MLPTVTGAYAGVTPTNYNICLPCPEWLQEDSLPCRSGDPDLFFPPNYGLQHKGQIAEAKQACFECPMLVACLDWAVESPDLDGIWAGTTPLERQRYRMKISA